MGKRLGKITEIKVLTAAFIHLSGTAAVVAKLLISRSRRRRTVRQMCRPVVHVLLPGHVMPCHVSHLTSRAVSKCKLPGQLQKLQKPETSAVTAQPIKILHNHLSINFQRGWGGENTPQKQEQQPHPLE